MNVNNNQSNIHNNISLSAQSTETSWAQVYDNYAPMMYGIILKMTNDETIAEEILEEVFLDLNAKNMLQELNSMICMRCAYKITLNSLTNRGLILSNTQPFDKNYPNINRFYFKEMKLEEIVINLEVTKDKALTNLRAEFNHLREHLNKKQNG